MARGLAARGSGRGGGGIQAARPPVARLAAVAVSLAACLGLAAYPVATADRYPELVAVPGSAAVLLVLPALLAGWPSAIAWTLALLGGEYAASVAIGPDDSIDGAAPLYAAGLLVLAELAYWSVDLGAARREEGLVHLRRLATIAVLAFVSVVLGSLVVLATAVPIGGGVAWDAVGVAAAVATLAVVALLARRAARD